MAGSITHWLHDLRQGDEDTVGKLWNRWFHRLCGKIAPHTRRLSICDEEDIALGAIYDLCDSLKHNKHPGIDDRNELWRMLSVIAVRKARDWRKYDQAGKRGGGKKTLSTSIQSDDQYPSSNEIPDLQIQFADDFRELMSSLDDPKLKEVVSLRLQGFTNIEIAEQLGCARRTVQYMLKEIRDTWASVAQSL